jgi:hypothetical protein
MAHLSGNPTWVDWPATTTMYTAAKSEAVENALDALPRGAVGRRHRTSDAPTANGSTETRVMWASASVLTGRYYRISSTNMGIYGSVANSFTQANLRYTTDGVTVPTITSTQLVQAVAALPQFFTGYTLDIAGFYAPGSDQNLRVLLSYTGSATPLSNAVMQGNPAYPIVLLIEDMGLAPGASGADL